MTHTFVISFVIMLVFKYQPFFWYGWMEGDKLRYFTVHVTTAVDIHAYDVALHCYHFQSEKISMSCDWKIHTVCPGQPGLQ